MTSLRDSQLDEYHPLFCSGAARRRYVTSSKVTQFSAAGLLVLGGLGVGKSLSADQAALSSTPTTSTSVTLPPIVVPSTTTTIDPNATTTTLPVEITVPTTLPTTVPATEAPTTAPATTEAPVVTTQAPVATTQAPTTTQAPVATTQAPTTTQAPVVTIAGGPVSKTINCTAPSVLTVTVAGSTYLVNGASQSGTSSFEGGGSFTIVYPAYAAFSWNWSSTGNGSCA